MQKTSTTPAHLTSISRHRLTWRICLERWMLGRFTYAKQKASPCAKTGSRYYFTQSCCLGLETDLPYPKVVDDYILCDTDNELFLILINTLIQNQRWDMRVLH